MNDKLPSSQHFYKIMMPGYNTELPLPKAFCQKLKLNGQHLEVATITSCKGTWEVKIEKSNSDLISFASGWCTFVREHDLSLGNIILFEHCGSMRFTVKMFDLNACEKKFLVNPTNKRDELTEEKPTKTSASDTSHFTTVITGHDIRRNFSALYIPNTFAKAHGLARKKSIILRDSTGEKWTVVLAHYTRNRVVMIKGFPDFCRSNNLKVGDSLTFRLRESPERCDFALMDVCISRHEDLM